ncbi:MAG TPA: glycosyltransferase [bacterium]
MTFLAIFFGVLCVYLTVCGWDNTRLFRKTPLADSKRKKWPLVSVCIPARNEETRIQPCLESFLKQDYPCYEVLVLDDQSTDRTFKLLKEYSDKSNCFKALRGKPLPRGWVGKPWACHQLSLKARGEWFFFTDADTWHSPDMLKRSVQAAEQEKADLLSCFTRQETKTWLEYLIIPVMVYCLIAFLPVRRVLTRNSFFSKFAGAGGQFLFFKRQAYKAIGGHVAVKNEIVEDLKIGNKLVQNGFRLVFLNGADITFCRMYHRAREVWEGFSKNFFPAFGFSVGRAVASYSFLLAVTFLPFILLFFATPWTLLFNSALALALLQIFLRLNQAWHYGLPVLSCFLHPLGNLLFVLIGLNSMRWYLWKGQGHWKGRILRR